MNWTIRALQPQDYAALVALDQAIRATSAAWPSFTDIIESTQELAALCAYGCSYFAHTSAGPIGALLAQPIAYHADHPLTIWVDALGVHPNARRRGVATALYHALGGQARAYAAKAILTHLPPANTAAQALHLRLGFEPHIGDTLLWRVPTTPTND